MASTKKEAPMAEGTITAAAKVTSIDWSKADVQIERLGRKIILPMEPGPMSIDQGIEALQRLKADEETILNTFEDIDSYYTDALVALNEAMRRKFGWSSPVPTPGFFGPTPPLMLTIATGPEPGEQIQVPWGSFKIPGIDNLVQTTMQFSADKIPILRIVGKIRKREQAELRELANLTREILKEKSIYKGMAIQLKVDANGVINHQTPPVFLPTNYIQPDDLVLNESERDQVDVSLWTPIRNTEACLKHGIPLKRGILLEGPYGTGKTLIATVSSSVCVENGWTFILLDNVSALKDALIFAKRYQPCVVFAEDAERVAGQRDERGNDLLNVIDGILGKNSQVITVLTTNHVDKLEQAMLRPGRLDAVISIRQPDAGAVQQLVRIYGRDLLDSGEDLSEFGTRMAGTIPAAIREVVERAKLAMIQRAGLRIVARDLMVAATGMESHLALLAPKPDVRSLGDRYVDVLREITPPVSPALTNGGGEVLVQQVKEMHAHLMD